MTKNLAKLVSSASLGLVLAGGLSGCATTNASRDYNLENTQQKPRIEHAEAYGAGIQAGSFLYLLLSIL